MRRTGILASALALSMGVGCGDPVEATPRRAPLAAHETPGAEPSPFSETEARPYATSRVSTTECPASKVVLEDRANGWTALRKIREAHDFAALEIYFAKLHSAYRAEPLCEEALTRATDVVATLGAGSLNDVAAWAAAAPSLYSHAAHAEALLDAAWSARGSRRRSDTPASRFDRMALVLREQQRAVEAATAFDPHYAPAIGAAIGADQLRGRCDAARRRLDGLVDRDPLSFHARRRAIHACLPRWGGSFEEMDAIARSAQSWTGANRRLRILLGFSAAERAERAASSKEWEEAIQWLTVALETGDWRGAWSRNLARYHSRNGDPEAGWEVANRSVASAPQEASGYLARGRVLRFAKRFEEAVDAMTDAVDRAPYWTRPLYWRGRSLANLRRFEEAREDYARVLRLDASDRYALERYMAIALETAPDFTGAVSLLSDLTTQRPDDPRLWLGLGIAQLRAGDERAAASFERFLERAGPEMIDDPRVSQFRLALARAQRGEASRTEAQHREPLPGLSLLQEEAS